MSTFNMRIDMGPEEAVDALNGYFEKVAQWFVGDMEPDIKLPMQVWVDTHEGLIKQRNLENTAWIVRTPISGSWGVPVGTIITLAGLPAYLPGWIHLTGTTLVRADYPLLWEFAQNSNNIVTDEEWFSQKRYGSFSYGDGETTFRVPLLVDFVRGYDPASGKTMGQWVEDKLQNLTGIINFRVNAGASKDSTLSGVFSRGGATSATLGVDSNYTGNQVIFDASRVARTGDETAPKHVLLPKYIYTGEVW